MISAHLTLLLLLICRIAAMQFLTKEESEQWLRTHASNAPQSTTSPMPVVESGNFERELGARIYSLLDKAIADCAPDDQLPIFLLVRETGVWPSNEHLLLYSLIRRHFNSSDSIESRPGHLASGAEREYIAAVAFLCVLYGWGFLVTGAQSRRSIVVDHDGNWKLLSS